MMQIKNLKFILCPLWALCMYSVNAQFITLRGNQFIDQNGHPFYPVICNYTVNLFCGSCIGSGSYSEDGDGSGLGQFDPADVELRPVQNSMDILPVPGTGLSIMRAAFGKMRAMGFNTVRLIGWCPMINGICTSPYTASECFKLSNTIENLSYACYSSWGGFPIAYYEPFSTDNNLNNVVMPVVKAAMQAAKDSGLNVMLDCLWIGDFSNSDAAADTANDMLTAIAASIASDAGGHPELLAYDLYNEPHWGVWTTNTNVKNKICQYTNMWYNNMKAVDPNHLITNGDVDPGDVMDWDPAVLQLDFNCLHPYPDFYRAAYDGYNEANMTSRYQALLYWETNNSPIPWIIAETGVGANDSTVSGYIPGVLNGQSIWGTLADQSAWAKQIQQIAINTGASGFGWWDFSDWEIGLLQPGHPNNLGGGVYAYDNSYDKPIVAEAFGANTVTHGTAQIAQPADYYEAWAGCSGCYTFSGTVVDQDGNPIKDAVIQGSNGANHAPYIDNSGILHTPKNSDGTVKCPTSVQFSITTFSKADGSFSLIAPVPSPSTSALEHLEYDYGKFDQIHISAAGAQAVFPWNQLTDAPSGSPSSTTIQLEKKSGVWDSNTGFQLIENGVNSPSVIAARHVLATNAFINIDAVADFHASSAVTITGTTFGSFAGFTAEQGSYTHIYCAPVSLDCSLLADAEGPYIRRPIITTSNTDTTGQVISKDIVLNYLLPSSYIRLMPNPAENYIYLVAPGDAPVGNAEITDALGHTVYAGKVQMDGQTPLNTSLFASGFYNVHVINNSDSQNFKLIISR